MTPLLVVVTGLPCTGKTALARRLAADLRLPLVYKDAIKERLFDTLGWNDREWSQKLGHATYEVLYYFVEAELAAGVSLVVESNFYPDAAQRFLNMREQYPFRVFQIYCQTERDALVARFMARANSTERHPGHGDQAYYAEFLASLDRPPAILGLGHAVMLDTTDFARIDYGGLLGDIHEKMRELTSP